MTVCDEPAAASELVGRVSCGIYKPRLGGGPRRRRGTCLSRQMAFTWPPPPPTHTYTHTHTIYLPCFINKPSSLVPYSRIIYIYIYILCVCVHLVARLTDLHALDYLLGVYYTIHIIIYNRQHRNFVVVELCR